MQPLDRWRSTSFTLGLFAVAGLATGGPRPHHHAAPSAESAAAATPIAGTTSTEIARAPRSTPTRPKATGRIEGTVEISAAITARRPQFRIYADPGAGALPPATPRAADVVAAEVRNVVLYLEGDSARLAGSPEQRSAHQHGSIAQRDERFSPHVLATLSGATIDFPNDDDVFHNVFSLSSAAGAKGFDLGRYPKGTSRSWTFPRAGTVQVFCHIHSDMSAILLVLPTPYFTSPDDSRRFVIDDVPEGEYTIVGWHERIKPVTRRIRVSAGQTTVVDFNIPLPQGGTGRP